MIIDKLLEYKMKFKGKNLSDAVLFKLTEGINDYLTHLTPEAEKSKITDFALPSLMPFDNFCVEHQDGFDWYVTQPSCTVRSQRQYFIHHYFCLKKDLSRELKRLREEGMLESTGELTFGVCLVVAHTLEGFPIVDMGAYSPRFPSSYQFALADRGNLEPVKYDKTLKFYVDTFNGLNHFLKTLARVDVEKKLNTPPAKLQKSRVKKGKLPLVPYYTLTTQS